MRAILSVLAIAITGHVCLAQDGPAKEEVATGRIFGKVWHTNVRMEDGFKYMGKVREELGIPSSPVMMMMTGQVDMGPRRLRKPGAAAADVEMKGTLFFLQLTPEVSLNNPISFELVEDLDSFTQLVTEQRDSLGEAAELIGSDDRYEVKLDFEKLASGIGAPAPADGKGEKGKTKSFSIVISSSVTANGPDGAKVAPPKAMSTFYRYVDGVMYSSRSKALFSVELPAKEELKLTDDDAGHDVYADFDLTQIPADMKNTFWSALESQAAVFLQRFDNEAEGEYSLRRILAEGRLGVLQRALFDIDRARFSLSLAGDGKPIVSQLRITARENSSLAAVLGVLSHSGTQHAALSDEQSPLIVSTTTVVPEFVRPFATAFVNSVNLRLKEAASETPGAEILVDDLTRPLQQTIDEGILDATVCLRGNVKDGLVPCAAVRLNSAEEFLSVLQSVLQVTAIRESLTVTPGKSGDYATISIRTKETQIPFAKASIPVQLNVCGTGSWLWMTLGDDRATAMLDEIVAKQSDATSTGAAAVPLLVRFQFNKWLGESDDEMSKVPAQWIETLERLLMKRTSPKMSISMNGQKVEQPEAEDSEFTSYAAKALKPENSELEIRVRAAERELLVDAKAGEGLAQFAVAQFLDSQSRMFKGMNFQFEAPGDGTGTVRRRVGTFNFGGGNAAPKE